MLFKKRLFLAVFLGVLFHLSTFFYIANHKIQLTPMQRQGVFELNLNEETSDNELFEEIDRDEVIHAFFSKIAPEDDAFESLVSTPEEIPTAENEYEELSLEEPKEIEHRELSYEVHSVDISRDPKLDLSQKELNAIDESSDGLVSATELLNQLELEGVAYGTENDSFIEPEMAIAAPSPVANINQGLALSESSLWDSKEKWEEELMASLESQDASFTSFYRGQEVHANSNTFDAKIEYLPRASHGDYLFRVSLVPKQGKNFKRIKQNIFFLLDRSNSINKVIYYKTRDALSSTLPYLHPEDNFNVLVFDDEIEPFSEKPVKATKENIQKAQAFLEKLKYGGVFAATDLYRSLDEIIPQKVSPQEANTAVLLSDGDTFLSLDKQRRTIGEWTRNNKGKVSLFSFAIGRKNNLPLLDAISSFNKGVLVHSPSTKALPLVLRNFIHSIRYPLGKNFKATSIPSETYMDIKLYPKNRRLPLFYENIPYTLYGSTTHLEDFVLFLQGKHYDSWLDIQVPISFSDAQIADGSIEKQFAIQQAYDYYEEFLNTGSMYPLMKAKELLDPFEIETAFGAD